MSFNGQMRDVKPRDGTPRTKTPQIWKKNFKNYPLKAIRQLFLASG